MHRINFTKHYAFQLEEGNLQRILSILSSSFGQSNLLADFQVETKSGKVLNFDTLDTLLNFDNTLLDPVHHLIIFAKHRTESAKCRVFFFGERKPNISGIDITVEADDPRWVKALTAEIEEQIARTRMNEFVYQVRQLLLARNMLSALIPVALAFFTMLVFFDSSRSEATTTHRQELEMLSSSAKTLEDKIEFLFQAEKLKLWTWT